MYGLQDERGFLLIGRLYLGSFVLTSTSTVRLGEGAPGGTGVLLEVVIC